MIIMKLRKIFKSLTLFTFACFMIWMLILFILDTCFNIKTNPDNLKIVSIIVMVLFITSAILWSLFHVLCWITAGSKPKKDKNSEE